jgi:hypothetical protein
MAAIFMADIRQTVAGYCIPLPEGTNLFAMEQQ